MRSRPRLRVLVPVAAVAGLLAVFAVVGMVSRGGQAGAPSQAAPDRMSTAAGTAEVPAPALSVDSSTSSKSGAGEVAAAIPPAAALSSHHMLRTGDLSLLVARGTLLSSVDRITAMTRGVGGYVMSSVIGSESPGLPGPVEPLPLDAGSAPDVKGMPAERAGTNPYAALSVRVPEDQFDAALKRFAALGEVQSVSTSSEDVTSQYVDLQARLRHYGAVERRLVRFLAATDNVNQMLAVQDRIDQVQLTIEQLSAQLKSLREATVYGTLSVFLREKGAQHAAAAPSDTFSGTLAHSLRVLGHGARVTGLVLTALLPFIVVVGGIGLVVWYVARRVRRGRPQPAQPSLPA